MRVFFVKLFISSCILSCNNSNQTKGGSIPNSRDTLMQPKDKRNMNLKDDNKKWLEVKYDMENGDYYIEYPCDGHTWKL
ncbi:MAG: hypothetical protein IPL25_19130 [Saprospiraceae bacterium]|nr:hypothetical protein [Candidatus Vicinibacter affinis]